MKHFFNLIPMLIHAAWITRKQKSEAATMVRMLLLLFVVSSVLLISSITDIRRDIADRINRHEIALQKRIKYPDLNAMFSQYDDCYGSPYALLKAYTKWLECDLAAMEKAASLGRGMDYIKFAAERDADIEFAGIKLFPVPDGPGLPPPRPK